MSEKGKYNYIYKIVFGLILFLSLFRMCYTFDRDEESLVKNKVLTYGTVLYTSRIPKSSGTSFWVEYEFKINDTLFQNKSTLHIDYAYADFVHNILFLKRLPIIYDKTNIENNRMLFSKDDYIHFGLVRPDTLSDIFSKLDSLSFPNKE